MLDEQKLLEDIESKMTQHGLVEEEKPEELEEGIERPIFDSLNKADSYITEFMQAFNQEKYGDAALALVEVVSNVGAAATRFTIAMRMKGVIDSEVMKFSSWVKKFKIMVR